MRLDSGRILVQSVDFFTPIVDDPYQFGQIAAADAQTSGGLLIAVSPERGRPPRFLRGSRTGVRFFAHQAHQANDSSLVISGEVLQECKP